MIRLLNTIVRVYSNETHLFVYFSVFMRDRGVEKLKKCLLTGGYYSQWSMTTKTLWAKCRQSLEPDTGADRGPQVGSSLGGILSSRQHGHPPPTTPPHRTVTTHTHTYTLPAAEHNTTQLIVSARPSPVTWAHL